MAVPSDYVDFIAELLAPLGPVATKRFFGGMGIFLDGRQFAFIIQDALYFKIDAATRPMFEAEVSGPFTYQTKTGTRTIDGYWRAPERLFDEPDEMVVFARAAYDVALRAAARKPSPEKTKPPRKAAAKPRKTPAARQ